MNSQTVMRKGATEAGHMTALATDRARQFAGARRHSFVVRLMKVVLPSIAMLSVFAYGTVLLTTSKFKAKGFAVEKVVIDPKNLTMEAPKYDGFAKDGAHYVIRAKEAVTDLRQSAPIRLNAIEGDIRQTDGVSTKLTANWGTYDQKQDVLELYEKIDIDGSTGMKARLTRATVFPKESRVVTNEPVYVESDSGNIRARQMTFNSKARTGTFVDDVQVRLKPQNPKPETGDSSDKGKQATAMPGLAANSGEPIDVRSDRLEFDDSSKNALFRENVVATQGEATLKAPELDIFYDGKAATAIDGGPKSPKQGAEPTATKLKSIKARGGVTMINKEQRANADTLDYDAAAEIATLKGNVVLTSASDRSATGAEAQFDQKRDTALITGNVVVTQGKNVLKGQRLAIDRKAGTTRLESPGGGRINTLFYQNEGKAPAQPKAVAKAATDAATTGAGMFSMKTDPSQPIDIDADTLDVFDQKRQAVYKGNIVARQGAVVMKTKHMTAHYTGQAGISAGPVAAAGKGSRGDGKDAAQLTKIEARQGVDLVGSDGQHAKGEWADFDVKANTVRLGGNYVVSSGPEGKRNVITGAPGDELLIDMTTGISRFMRPDTPQVRSAPAVSAASATNGAGTAEGQGSQRLRAVFYPKEEAKAAKQPLPKKPKTGSSSWESTTTGEKQ